MATTKTKLSAWDVWDKGVHIDTVWFNTYMDSLEVRRSLIDHDGYPDTILVFVSVSPITSSALLNPFVALADARPYKDRQRAASAL